MSFTFKRHRLEDGGHHCYQDRLGDKHCKPGANCPACKSGHALLILFFFGANILSAMLDPSAPKSNKIAQVYLIR